MKKSLFSTDTTILRSDFVEDSGLSTLRWSLIFLFEVLLWRGQSDDHRLKFSTFYVNHMHNPRYRIYHIHSYTANFYKYESKQFNASYTWILLIWNIVIIIHITWSTKQFNASLATFHIGLHLKGLGGTCGSFSSLHGRWFQWLHCPKIFRFSNILICVVCKKKETLL